MSSGYNHSMSFHKIQEQAFEFKQVRGTSEEALWDQSIEQYHYLGNKMQNGHFLKYLVYRKGSIVAALSWKAGCLRLRVRDHFIGWTPEKAKALNKHIVNNSRFLIMPSASMHNLGSFIMSRSLKLLAVDWEKNFGYKPWLAETFIDSRYFDGALYKASNWVYIGQTSGFGKGWHHNYHGNIKEVYIYEIVKNYRNIIGCSKKTYNPLHTPPKWTFIMEDSKMMLRQKKWEPGSVPDINLTEEYVETLAGELENFHEIFSECYTRKEQEINGLNYLSGLFSSLPRKSIEPIALNSTSSVRGLQRFMKNSVWDEEKMRRIHQEELIAMIGDENGMITLDPSDIPKKGKESVGVHRQHCGSTGKVDNCQCGIHLGYTSDNGYGLINSQLYIPEKWFSEEYEQRFSQTLIPKDLNFETKNKIASKLINQAITEGVKARWIGVDSAFGADIKFLESLPQDKWYFAGIKSNEHVFQINKNDNLFLQTNNNEADILSSLQNKKSISVLELSKSQSVIWEDVVLGEGAKGPIITQMSFHRIYRSRGKQPVGKQIWLIMRKHADGQIRFSVSNAPSEISRIELMKASTMRWPIEQCFGDGKGFLGMDHYEHRSWPAWNRHMTFVALGLHLLLKLRLKTPSKKKQHI